MTSDVAMLSAAKNPSPNAFSSYGPGKFGPNASAAPSEDVEGGLTCG